MISLPSGGSVAARAILFMSTHALAPLLANKAQYATNTATAVTALQQWYDPGDGLWTTTGWWNSANLMTVLADFAGTGAGGSQQAAIAKSVFATTFANAQQVRQTAVKVVNEAGLVTSSYTKVGDAADAGKGNGGFNVTFDLEGRDISGFAGFINDFYDDEGWWALAWMRAYDVTRDNTYLAMAQSIFADMQGGASPPSCGGGIWWSKDRAYKNAIANELFLAVAAGLANRVGVAHGAGAAGAAVAANYASIAAGQWAWFKASGMINAQGLINDGLTIQADGSCVNNGRTAWSYNQGVVLGALVELHHARGGADASLLPAAVSIAKAAIAALSTNGILHESCEASGGSCGGDAPTFKGVFLRNLHYLQREPSLAAADAAAFKTFILQNADSIWNNDRLAGSNQLGLVWSGPPAVVSAATHGAAMDCLVGAVVAA